MSQDWPSPKRPEQGEPLPTTAGLPLSSDGYDRASVDEAFAAFYRHISQLDTSLRTLEAVESFRQQAAELRADLRSIRAAGWTPYARGYPALPPDGLGFSFAWALPEALPRLALEVVFLVVVAVIAAVGGFGAVAIVAVMAAAVALIGAFEWLATRGRRPVPLPAAPVASPPSPPEIEADGVGWAAFADGPAVVDADTEAELEPPPEPEPESPPVAEQAPEPEPEPVSEATAEIEATDADGPSLVRDLAPWERGFDGDTAGGLEDEASLPR